MRRLGTISIILILISIVPAACIKKIDHSGRTDFFRFFPLNQWDQFQYSGPMGKAVVSAKFNDLYTITYYDRTGRIYLWQDFLKSDRAITWKNAVPAGNNIPAVHFEPALPFIPWSRTIGDTLLVSSSEIRADSANSHLHLQVEYEIVTAGPITTPAGTFPDCVQIRMSFKSLYTKEKRIFGVSHWWFARDIGIVKYILPEGSGELLSARIDGKNLP